MANDYKLDKKTGFRLGTNNLVLSGLEEELKKAKTKFAKTRFKSSLHLETVLYEDIPKKIILQKGSSVHLVRTDDETGRDLLTYDMSKVREWLNPYDTVIELTRASFDGGSVAIGKGYIKYHGEYIGIFAE